MPLLFNFTLECSIRKVRGNQVGLKLNGTHQLLVYAGGMNLVGNIIDTVNKNTETIVDAIKDVSFEIHIERAFENRALRRIFGPEKME
jgi:hypothetical protein